MEAVRNRIEEIRELEKQYSKYKNTPSQARVKRSSDPVVMSKEEIATTIKELADNTVIKKEESLNVSEILKTIELRYKPRVREQTVDYDTAKKVLFKIITERLNQEKVKYIPCKKQGAVIRELILYFIDSPESKYELHKGIMLCGNQGTTKTFLIECLLEMCHHLNIDKVSKLNDAQAINDLAKEKGISYLEKYYSENRFFDDVGRENRASKHYHEEVDAFSRIFFHRCKRFKKQGIFTFITTNNSFEEFSEMYGSKILGRLVEMVSVTNMDTKGITDFRGRKS